MGHKFMTKLPNITHKQSIYRNMRKHFHREGGLTETENKSMLDRVEELMHTDLDKLLLEHTYLMGLDF